MTKNEFLSKLRDRLSGLPEADAQRSLEYYGEMIDDRTEDGLTEEEAVAAIGTPEEIAERIISEIPLPQLVKARVQKSRTPGVGEILLLILGAPLWLPLLLAAVCVLAAIYISLWAVVISLYATAVALGACAIAFLGMVCLFFLQGFPLQAVSMIGFSLMFAGLCIPLGIGGHYAACGLVRGIAWTFKKIKSAFIKKEVKE